MDGKDDIRKLARALQLDEAERAHLFDLVHTAASTSPARRRPTQERVRPSVQQILDSISAPAYVRNGRLDILAANPLGAALYSEVYVDPVRPANTARFLFLNPRATEFFVDWDTIAHDAVLRAEAGRDPYDPGQRMLIYTAEPGSPSHDALNLLASWTSTPAGTTPVESEQPRRGFTIVASTSPRRPCGSSHEATVGQGMGSPRHRRRSPELCARR